jgi:NhaA family Na+:H+ antiporter
MYIVGISQKYSLPLVSGVLLALIWSNIEENSYLDFQKSPIIEGVDILGHGLSLQFIINDVFMCFFFGLAMKEVTEAFLPGGSLNPIRRAINPIFATLGGVVGPIVVFNAAVSIMYSADVFSGTDCSEGEPGGSAHRRLSGHGGSSSSFSQNATGNHQLAAHEDADCTLAVLINGWAVPTATDISLAWVMSLQVFGAGHPAINFMLLLAILDDAIGMVIIALFYGDPANPVEPLWLLFVIASSAIALVMSKVFNIRKWWLYILISGPVSWLGLLKAHVHPALALVFIVPCMPAEHALYASGGECNLGACDLGPAKEVDVEPDLRQNSPNSASSLMKRLASLFDDENAPLHVFESTLKKPVDFGMFFFGLANAGVSFGSMGGLTAAVVLALCVGKTAGIFTCSVLAKCLGFGLPPGLSLGDLLAMSALAGIGLTVALFLANEAYVQPELRGQAKMGAVLSIGCAFVGWAIQRLVGASSTTEKDTDMAIAEVVPSSAGPSDA